MIEIKENNGDKLLVDMWYGDKFEPEKFRADATFYPQGCFGYHYRGNIFNDDGKIIGDYAAVDSITISRNFLTNFIGLEEI